MKNVLILSVTLLCCTIYADNVKRIDIPSSSKSLNSTSRNIQRLKSPTSPKRKKTASEQEDQIIEVSNAPIKTWKSLKGNSIRAKLVGLSSEVACYVKADGKKIKISRDELVDKDQAYLNNYDATGEFPIFTVKNIAVATGAFLAFILFAVWFVKDKKKKTKYVTPKQNITIGTGI